MEEVICSRLYTRFICNVY